MSVAVTATATDSTRDRPAVPVAWVLCRDERMYRFLEIELAHLGLETVSEPSSDRPPCLVVADTDAYPVETLLRQMVAADCPLLGFGYDPADIPPSRGSYLRRPFSLPLLERALRTLSGASVTTASPLAQRAEAAPAASSTEPLAMDEDTCTVTIGTHRIPLTPAEWAIFRRLYEHRGETVSREELTALLGGGTHGINSNSVEVYICHLRRKMEKPLGRRMIATVRGKGYLWT